jgi:hypothetical protein
MKTQLFTAIAAGAALALGAGAPALADTAPTSVVASAPAYTGTPDVNVTAAFYGSGGGPGGFSIVRSMKSMIGEEMLQSEMTKLAATYGQTSADLFPHMFDYAIGVAWQHASADNVMIPPFGSHEGQALARDLIQDGTAPDGTFFTSYLFDKTLTKKVHAQVMNDLVSKYGAEQTATFDNMSNQLFFDISQTLGKNVSLAPNH